MRTFVPWIILASVAFSAHCEAGKTCPQRTRSHSSRCDQYFECSYVPNTETVEWIVRQCEEGLIFEASLEICVLPDIDWECNLPGEEVVSISRDDSNVYGINNLDLDLILNLKPEEFPNNINDENEEIYNMIETNIRKVQDEYERKYLLESTRLPKADVEREEGSGFGESSENIVNSQLIHLNQLIQNMRNKNQQEPSPDQLNSFLAVQKIQTEPVSTSTEAKVAQTPDGEISPEHVAAILNMTDGISTTPGDYMLSSLALPTQVTYRAPMREERPGKYGVSEEILKLMLELSKQLVSNSQNSGDRPIYITVPVQTPGHNGQTYQVNSHYNSQEIGLDDRYHHHHHYHPPPPTTTAEPTTTTTTTTEAPTTTTTTRRPHRWHSTTHRPIPGIKVEAFGEPHHSSGFKVTAYTEPADKRKRPPHPHDEPQYTSYENHYEPNGGSSKHEEYYEPYYPPYRKPPQDWNYIKRYSTEPLYSPTAADPYRQQGYQLISTSNGIYQSPPYYNNNYTQPPLIDSYGFPVSHLPYPYSNPFHNPYPQRPVDYFQAYNNPFYKDFSGQNAKTDQFAEASNHDGGANEINVPEEVAENDEEEQIGDEEVGQETDYDEAEAEEREAQTKNNKKYVDLGGSIFPYDTYIASILPLIRGTPKESTAQIVTCISGSRQANRTDCTKYFVCNPKTGGIFPFSCPSATAFDPNNKYCTKQHFQTCTKATNANNLLSSYVVPPKPKPTAASVMKIRPQKVPVPEKGASQDYTYDMLQFLLKRHSTTTQPPMPLDILQKLAESLKNEAVSDFPTTTAKPRRTFTCLQPGKVPDPDSKKHYIVCFKTPDNFLKLHKLKCPGNFEFCRKRSLCMDPRKCY